MTVLSNGPDQDIDRMTKSELLAYANSLGVPGVDSTMKKAEILEAVRGYVV